MNKPLFQQRDPGNEIDTFYAPDILAVSGCNPPVVIAILRSVWQTAEHF